MTREPNITVGIPVFNAMPYLPQSVESILRQSYTDFRVLIINDGSTDGSARYLDSIKDPRVRVVHQFNRGLTSTLNRMLREAPSTWLMRHDGDDVASPQRIQRTVDYVGQYPHAGMFYSLAEYYPAGSAGKFRSTRGTPDEIRNLVLSGYLPSFCHPSVTLNIAKTNAAGGYRFDLHIEDLDLWWRMALKYDIRFIPEILVGFRQNSGSVSSKNLAVQTVHTLFVQYLLLSHLWTRQPLGIEEVRVALSQLLNSRKLAFRSHLRAFNIELGRGHRSKALGEAVSALLASPGAFLRRVLDELGQSPIIAVGESPGLFSENEDILWPTGNRKQLRGEPLTFADQATH